MMQVIYSLLGENYKGYKTSEHLVHFFGGGLAGITASSTTYPLDLVRTRLAAQVIVNYFSGKNLWRHILSSFMGKRLCFVLLRVYS